MRQSHVPLLVQLMTYCPFNSYYSDVIMGTMASQITGVSIVCSTVLFRNIKAPCHWHLCGEFTGTGEFPAQKASNAENASTWWSHHACSNLVWYKTIRWVLVMVTFPNFMFFVKTRKVWLHNSEECPLLSNWKTFICYNLPFSFLRISQDRDDQVDLWI